MHLCTQGCLQERSIAEEQKASPAQKPGRATRSRLHTRSVPGGTGRAGGGDRSGNSKSKTKISFLTPEYTKDLKTQAPLTPARVTNRLVVNKTRPRPATRDPRRGD